MALYKMQDSLRERAQNQYNGAMRAMGGMTRENQTTEVKAPATQIVNQGVGLTGTANQLWNLGEKGYAGLQWLYDKFNAPDVKQTAANANTGAQAPAQVGEAAGIQANTGVQAGEPVYEPMRMPDFINGGNPASQMPPVVQADLAQMEPAGNLAAQGVKEQMYAMPEYLGGDPGLAAQSAQTASQIKAVGPESLTGGITTLGSSVGGIGGGLAGRELGRAIGGDTGAAIGGVAGSLGGAYLGGLAMSGLAGGISGAAGGAAAGAAAGSAVPGLGTFIGAGLGALTSLFL